MALGPFTTYVPPGTYTRTLTETNAAQIIANLRIPAIIGVGQEELEDSNLEMIRGSSAGLDQQIISESVSDRFVADETNPSNPILGGTNGARAKFRVRHYPIVTGEGFGRAATLTSTVQVTVNGQAAAVGSVQGSQGYVTLQVPPQEGDDVRVTYYFRRTDTSFTDDVSSQVAPTAAELVSPGYAPFDIVAGSSDTFVLKVDGVEHTILLPPASYTAQGLVTQIESAGISGLAVAVSTDAAGNDHVAFTAAQKLEVGSGNANGALGFSRGTSTRRNAEFRVFQRPVVDGTDGGITTNDTSKITVLVDGLQVIPTALDGTNGVVTLPMPPAPGSEVTIQYFANTWQDTFDYLPRALVTEVLRCGFAPSRSDYIAGQDFVVENPTADVSVIHWGTSVGVRSGAVSPGSAPLDDTQVLTTLVDDKMYLAETTRFVDTRVVPAVISEREFILPAVPTIGNGRDTSLGQALYNSVANSRMGLPSNRPDLVQVWAGRNPQDALGRNPLTVLEVDSSTRHFKVRESVPPDHKVYATFNYSRIRDDQYVITNKVAGAVGVGQFEVLSVLENRLIHQVRFGNKTNLPETVQWPRGVEQVPDAFHTGAGTPVNEVVTVTFGTTAAQNAQFTNSGQAPYSFYAGASDQLRLDLNGSAFTVDLDTAVPAALVGGRIPVDSSDQVTIVTGVNDSFNITIDGTDIDITLDAGVTTISDLVGDINDAIDAVDASGSGGIDFTGSAPNNLVAYQRIGGAGGDHVITISGLNAPAALPGGFDDNYYVAIRQGNAAGLLGFAAFQRADATATATNKPATILGSLAGPFNVTASVNDTLNVQVNGIDYTVTLPAGASVAASAIVTAINNVVAGLASAGTGANFDKVRLTSSVADASSRIVIKPGSANTVLGFSSGDSATYTRVTAQEVVNEIMASAGVVAEGFARVQTIDGRSYIRIESINVGAATSSISFADGVDSAFNSTTGVGIVPGVSGDNGEDAAGNFVVSSSHPQGSAGTGFPGQTYTDENTGLRFTILPSSTGSYTGNGSFTLNVSETWNVNPSVPYLSIPGLEVVVTDTVGVGTDDTGVIQTFNPGGLEPAIGDSYFISYRYRKLDFSTKLFAQFKAIEANYGGLSAENRVTLASWLAMINGAVLVAVKQVLKQPNSNQASDGEFLDALDELTAPLPGNVRPDIIVPLATSTSVYTATMQHVETMSLPQNQMERMSFIGFASGTVPTSAQAIARGLLSSRMVALYPDSAVVTLTDEAGNNVQNLVDGTFLAAAVAGSAVSPSVDVATPFTRRRIQGFTRLPRIMDLVEKNQTAMAGITVLDDLDPIIRIRQGLTTDMGHVLTRLPTVTQIRDYVQQSSRNTLDVYVGTKFLASRKNDVEVSLTSLFKQLAQAEIVAGYQGIVASVDEEDPTILRVEAAYAPILPLLYIMAIFNLRSRIN